MSYPLKFPVSATDPFLTVIHPKQYLWVIELHNGEDNRLTTFMIERAIKPALDAVEQHWREQSRAVQGAKGAKGAKGALIIVGKRSQDKFFSNGLDYANIVGSTTFFPDIFNPLLARVLAFPIPTIAAINGHCFAGGMMLSLACDYRVMTDASKRRAWITMNEIHFGASWPPAFALLMRAKISDPRLHRKIALEGHRFSPREALEAGFVDHIVQGNTAAVLAKAEEVAESVCHLVKEGVWGAIKTVLHVQALEFMNKGSERGNSVAPKSRL